jgi:hypothetical protein
MLHSVLAYSQGIAINNDGSNANSSAMLDVKSTNSGMLIPRMTQAERNGISSPASSLLIYQTDNTPGFYYYDGSAWVRISVGSDSFNDNDADPANEIQNISISGHDITLSDGGGTVTVPDANTTYSAGNQLSLSGTTFNVSEGSGSGLDADLLDGHEWSEIAGLNGWTDDGTVVRLTTSSDDVGIGTSSPQAQLHITENLQIGTDGVTANHVLSSWTENGYETNFFFRETPTHGMGIRYNATDNKLYFDRYADQATPTPLFALQRDAAIAEISGTLDMHSNQIHNLDCDGGSTDAASCGWVNANDDNTTYSAGNQLSLSGTTFNVSEGSGSGLDADLLDGHQWSEIEANDDYLPDDPATSSVNMNDYELQHVKALQGRDWDDDTGGADNKYRLLWRDGAHQFYNGGVVVGSYGNGTWTDLPDGRLIVQERLGVGGNTSPTESIDVTGSTKVSGDYYLNSGHYIGIKGDHNILIDDANPDWQGNPYGGVIDFRGDNDVNKSKLNAGSLELTRDIQVTGRYFDSNASSGTSGQVLSSSGSGTQWAKAQVLQSNSGTVSAGNWYRIASNGGNRADATFTLRDQISGGGHSTMRFHAGVNYGDENGISFTLISHSRYSSPTFTKVRIIESGTYDGAYLEVYCNRSGSVSYDIFDNLQSSGWTPVDWTTGSIPSGWTAHEYEADRLFAIGETDDMLSFTRSGRLAIGTDNPGSIVNIYGAGSSSGSRSESTVSSQVFIGQTSYADSYGAYFGKALELGYDTSSDYGFIHAANIYPSSGTGPRALVLQPNGGNVAIGTTSPGAKLDIMDNTDSGIMLYLTDDNNSTGELAHKAIQVQTQGNIQSWIATNGDAFFNGEVGIGTTSPDNLLDINGKVSLTQSSGDEMVIINDDIWEHGYGNQDFGDGGDHFMMGSREGAYESCGIYGDGDHVTIWSPGDGAPGQPSALLYILDEDSFNGTDTDPFNNNALKAYVSTSGVWTTSDSKKKQNKVKISNPGHKLSLINGYSFEYTINKLERNKEIIPQKSYGVMAQELELILPDAVQTNKYGDKFVNYSAIIPLLIEGIKEQQEIIDTQQMQIEELQERVDELSEIILE